MRCTWLLLPALMVGGASCSATGERSLFNNEGGGAGTSGQGGSAGVIQIDGGQGGILNIEPPCSAANPSADSDTDGWTVGDGDCNDCTAQMNPGAYDYAGNAVDEDCNGVPDDEPLDCDQMLPLDGNNPMDAAKSMGLCRETSAQATGPQRTWGVISANYVFPDGSLASGPPHDLILFCIGVGGPGAPPNALSHGVLPSFGPVVMPRHGGSMVALSSGIAREGINGASPANAQMCTQSATPPGFPTPSTECNDQQIDNTPVANDPIALELVIRTPSNAKSFSFDFDFYTYEYPEYICDNFNDFFVALLFSQHPDVPPNKNISFDSKGNPVSVNNGFLEVCSPGTYGRYGQKFFGCALGTGELTGTGFDGHAATGWLQTNAPVVPGEEITLRLGIWDMGDEVLDSSVLIDNFRWEVDEGETQTIRPPR